jgi:hypothetical protein
MPPQRFRVSHAPLPQEQLLVPSITLLKDTFELGSQGTWVAWHAVN